MQPPYFLSRGEGNKATALEAMRCDSSDGNKVLKKKFGSIFATVHRFKYNKHELIILFTYPWSLMSYYK